MAPLDASTGEGEARIVSSALRKGVRMELIVAPASFLLPAVIAYVFIDLGLRTQTWSYVLVGATIFGGNVVFDYLMVRTALRFLRRTRPLSLARGKPPA